MACQKMSALQEVGNLRQIPLKYRLSLPCFEELVPAPSKKWWFGWHQSCQLSGELSPCCRMPICTATSGHQGQTRATEGESQHDAVWEQHTPAQQFTGKRNNKPSTFSVSAVFHQS
jgi:hypothetical protein